MMGSRLKENGAYKKTLRLTEGFLMQFSIAYFF